ncbi:MAG: SdrD B-like domain-containing protein [Vicinamibacterales bacterium]
MRAGAPTVSGPASFDVPYTIEVTNVGGVPATNLQVTDSLSAAFATGKPTVSMATAPAASGGCSVNGSFTGVGDNPALVGGGTLNAGQTCTITMTARITCPEHGRDTKCCAGQQGHGDCRKCPAGESRSRSVGEAGAAARRHHAGADRYQATGGEPVFDIGFRIVVRNTTEADAHNVQVTDNLSQTFTAGSPTLTVVEGPTIGLLTAPTASTAGAQSATETATGTPGLTLSPDFNGTTVKTLLTGDDTLPAGREQIITMTVRVRYPGSDAIPVDADLSSTPVVTTSVTPGGIVITRDESTDVTSTAADPQPDDAPHPTMIRLNPAARLIVQKVASTRVAEIGDSVQYAVRVSNVGSSKLPAVVITDQVPLGFRYVEGSARLLGDGAPAKIPDPAARGGVLTFTLPEQQTNAATITYRLRLGPGADRSDGVNVAQATSGSARSGAARAKVLVAGGVFATEACIIGKVFADLDGNGVQRAGEPGIPDVHLTLEDGTTLISDGEGQYSYCGLTPSTHVIVVDSMSMPRGAVLVPAGHRNAGDGRSQFVDVKNGELRRVDFIEGSRNPAVLAEIEARRVADKGWRPSFTPDQRPATAVTQAAVAADTSRVISIGNTSMSLAESLAPAMRDSGAQSGGFAGAAMTSPGVTPAPFAPGVRSMFVVGLLDGILSLNTQKNSSGLAVSPGTAFERELSRLSGSFADGRGRYAGRGALFVRGQIAGDIGITVAYDSEKNTGTPLFRDIQPDAYYPITGDSSRKMFDAQSSNRFYAKVEHGRSFGLFGDIIATTLGGDARRLGSFNRALTGVQTRVETGRLTVAGFASHTALRQVVDEIAALGLSGPYSVSHPNGVSGSERVEIVTRDRNQPAVVLQTQPMTRLTDYEFEPFTGRILFRRPIPSLDERMNPVSIRVTYEIDMTTDGSDPVKAWVGGIDTALRVTKAIEFGGAWIDDETSGKPYRLRSANSTIRFGKGTTLTLEGAQSRGTVGSGALLTTVAAATAEGAAARLELKHHSSRVLARAFVATAQAGFVNPSAGLTPGRTEAGASAVATLTPSVKVVADAVHSEDIATGATRDGAMVAVDATIARALGVEVGIRRSSQSANSGAIVPLTASSTDGFGLGPNGTAIDPVSGLPLSRPGLTTTLSSAGATPTPASDETTMRAKVTFMPSKRANVYAEAEQDIRESAKRMAAVGLQVQVSTLNRAYARHEFISSLDSPYALNPAQRRDATIIGLASSVTANSDVFSEYRMRSAIDGRDAEAAIGLRNQWTLAEGLHVATSIERLQALSGIQRESTAVTGGMDYTRLSNLKATARLEWRQDLTTQSWLSTLGVAERLSSSWTLLAKNYYQWVQQRTAAGQMQNRFSIGGAFRNPNSNRLNLLSRYELRVDRTFGATDVFSVYRRVQSVSTHVDYQPARGWTLSGQHAAKWVDDRTDGSPERVRAQLLSGRLGVDVFSRLDVGALGSLMWGSGGGREQALGAEVGVLLRGNWWLSFGDNAVGFRDNDFDVTNTTARGPFTRLRLKFD